MGNMFAAQKEAPPLSKAQIIQALEKIQVDITAFHTTSSAAIVEILMDCTNSADTNGNLALLSDAISWNVANIWFAKKANARQKELMARMNGSTNRFSEKLVGEVRAFISIVKKGVVLEKPMSLDDVHGVCMEVLSPHGITLNIYEVNDGPKLSFEYGVDECDSCASDHTKTATSSISNNSE